MSDGTRLLSRMMLLAGAGLLLAALGWGIWLRLQAPPPPSITEEGAVVLAVTAPATAIPSARPTSPAPTAALPARNEPRAEGPTPDLLPDWPTDLETPASAPLLVPATAEPTPSATPVPTAPPKADRPPTRIVAPRIKLDAEVAQMGWETVEQRGALISTWNVPKNAAGWHMNSGLPGGGENVVLSGHHNIAGKVFRYVVDLQPGDEITLYVGDTPYRYIVSEKYILKEAGMPLAVRKKNAQWIQPTGDERLTLVTCWPYEWPGNTHRVIVVARPGVGTTKSTDTED